MKLMGQERRASATIIDYGAQKRLMEKGRARFPIPDKTHAKLALARLSQAKGLSPDARKRVAQRAANVLGKVTPGAERYGVTRLSRSRAGAVKQGRTYIEGRRMWIERRQKVRLD